MSIAGVSTPIVQSIIDTCSKFKTVRTIILYGSRARGDYKQGSDIDLAIDAPQMSDSEFSQLWNLLEDLPIIYPMDIVHLQSIKNQEFFNAIQKEGITLIQIT
jgi:predicted nucleotidyltransferase